MKTDKKNTFVLLQFILDVIVVYVSYFIIVWIREWARIPFSSANIVSLKIFLPYAVVIFVLLFIIYKLYNIDVVDFYETFLGIFFTSFIIFILGFALPFFLRAFAVPRSVILVAFPVQLVLFSLSHLLIKKIYFSFIPTMNVLIITKDISESNAVSDYFRQYLPKVKNEEFLSLDKENFKDALSKKLSAFDLFVIGDGYNGTQKSKIIDFLNSNNKSIYVVPEPYDLLLLNQRVHILGDFPLFEVKFVDLSAIDIILKRMLDLVVSVVALVIFSPLILIVSIAIVRETGRPIFYLQDRVGLNGKVFKIVKFRTMIQDAEKYTGAILSKEDDPRVTKVGKFLRKTGLDEIPQFVNVLRGEMSVVGPRPERPELMEKIKEDVPNFDMRLKLKPGITGYAQLFGKYGTSFDYKLKMDLLYARSRNIILTDIYIIINTVKLFLTPKKRR